MVKTSELLVFAFNLVERSYYLEFMLRSSLKILYKKLFTSLVKLYHYKKILLTVKSK